MWLQILIPTKQEHTWSKSGVFHSNQARTHLDWIRCVLAWLEWKPAATRPFTGSVWHHSFRGFHNFHSLLFPLFQTSLKCVARNTFKLADIYKKKNNLVDFDDVDEVKTLNKSLHCFQRSMWLKGMGKPGLSVFRIHIFVCLFARSAL